jgi:hypothetical protein
MPAEVKDMGILRNGYLLLHQINPGNHFGNAMFNLNARIYFKEIKILIIQEEFNRTCPVKVNGPTYP